MNQYAEYRLWIITIYGGLSVLLLTAIWHYYYSKRRRPYEPPDYGLLFLCAGLGVWCISAVIGLSNGRIENAAIRHALSMINNGLIACSFPFFEYSVISDGNQTVRKYWTVLTLSITGIILIAIFIIDATQNEIAGDILDFLSSAIVLLILTGILFKTFDKRKLKPLGYFSILVMSAMLMSQFFLVFEKYLFVNCKMEFLAGFGPVLGGISFSMFILILVSLTFTWILDRSEVFDEWKIEDEAQLFWNKYTNNIVGGIEELRNEIAFYGLSGGFFNKLMYFFKKNEPFNNVELQNLYEEAVISSARFHTSQREKDKGVVGHTEHQTNTNQLFDSVIKLTNRIKVFLETSTDTYKPTNTSKVDEKQ